MLHLPAHPSTARLPITVSLYKGPLLCDFNVCIKGLNRVTVMYVRSEYVVAEP